MSATLPMRLDAWRFEDLDELHLDDWRCCQIIDGTLIVSPPPPPIHELLCEGLRVALRPALPTGYLAVGPAGLRLDPTYLIPDVVVAPVEALRRVRGLVEPSEMLLAAEVVSPSSVSMDRIVKPAKYSAAGIRAYWRVETDPLSLTAYALRTGTYAELGTWRAGEVAQIAEPFPVTVDLNALLLSD